MLHGDFSAASFITQGSISSAGPVLRIIKNALIQAGHPVNQSPGQPVIKALTSELYGTSDNGFNEAKEIYRRRYAELKTCCVKHARRVPNYIA
jgi:hypothetical protein